MVKVRPPKHLLQGCCVFVTCVGQPQIYTKMDQVDDLEGYKCIYLWEPRNVCSFSAGELDLLMKHPVMYMDHEFYTAHRSYLGFLRIPVHSSKTDC